MKFGPPGYHRRMVSVLRLEDYMIPSSVARIPVLGSPRPPIQDYFKLLHLSLENPNGTRQEFKAPEAFEPGNLLVFTEGLKLSPNTTVPEYVETAAGVVIRSDLTPEAGDTVRFTYTKLGVFESLWKFNKLPVEAPDGVLSTFHVPTPVYCDYISSGDGPQSVRPYLFVWVSGVGVRPTSFLPPNTVTLDISPDQDELVEFLYLPEH